MASSLPCVSALSPVVSCHTVLLSSHSLLCPGDGEQSALFVCLVSCGELSHCAALTALTAVSR